MNLSPALKEAYTKEHLSARDAQRLAEFIAWGPVVFQASRLMIKFGILDLLRDNIDGLTQQEIADKTKLSLYAVKVSSASGLPPLPQAQAALRLPPVLAQRSLGPVQR